MNQELILKLLDMLVNTDEVKADSHVKGDNRAVVVFANNAIVFGYSSDYKLGEVTLDNARYCYYYAKPDSDKKKGFMALAKYGPAKSSKVSSPVDRVTVDACCIIDASKEAIEVWESSEWKS